MKKIVLQNGSIAGAIVALMLIIGSASVNSSGNFEGSMMIGFIGMLVAFIFIFVGTKKFRDKCNNGLITFGQAFKVGILIALIASTFYVVTWTIEFKFFFTDFWDKYAEHGVKEVQASGLSEAEAQDKIKHIHEMGELYKNNVPFMMLITYSEILPLGILVTLISSFVYRKKAKV
jgi:hypothetical protein